LKDLGNPVGDAVDGGTEEITAHAFGAAFLRSDDAQVGAMRSAVSQYTPARR
jgi:hypothetical protein